MSEGLEDLDFDRGVDFFFFFPSSELWGRVGRIPHYFKHQRWGYRNSRLTFDIKHFFKLLIK